MGKYIVLIFIVGIIFFVYKDSNKTANSVVVPTAVPITGKMTFIPYVEPTISDSRLWDIIQEWKTDNNQNSYVKDQRLCDIANLRLNEIDTDWSHNGFWKYTKTLKYKEMGENLANDMHTEFGIFQGWLNSASHAAALKKNYKYSCLRCEGSRCVHLFANF